MWIVIGIKRGRMIIKDKVTEKVKLYMFIKVDWEAFHGRDGIEICGRLIDTCIINGSIAWNRQILLKWGEKG